MNCEDLYIRLAGMSQADRKATPAVKLVDPEPESDIAHDTWYEDIERIYLIEQDDVSPEVLMAVATDADQYLVLE